MNSTVSSPIRTILAADAEHPPEVRGFRPHGVLDEKTFQTIEIDALFDAVDRCATRCGSAALYRALAQPLTDPERIAVKQAGVRELQEDAALRESLSRLIASFAALEEDFFKWLYGHFVGLLSSVSGPQDVEGFGYREYLRGTRAVVDLIEGAAQLTAPKSTYLQGLLESLAEFSRTRSYALIKGPVFRTEHAVITADQRRWYVPAIRFRPSLFKPVGVAVTAAVLFFAMQILPGLLEMAVAVGPLLGLFLVPAGLLYIPVVGGFDRDGVIYPLRNELRKSSELAQAIDVLGALDELLSWQRWAAEFPHPTVLPSVRDQERHVLRVQDARNPVLAARDAAYVGNDLALNDSERLTFVTGPNSGGKTAFCKTLAQLQVLTQTGAPVPAKTAEFSVADRVCYQVPEISHLDDGEGRFGAELKRTKEIFLSTTARSLVILDELSEGTTHEEKIEISATILDGFRKKGNSTVLITHNHQLVDHYREQGIGLAKQVQFASDKPTYRLVDGVSRVSHADRVAKKLGFAKEDIERYLSEGG